MKVIKLILETIDEMIIDPWRKNPKYCHKKLEKVGSIFIVLTLLLILFYGALTLLFITLIIMKFFWELLVIFLVTKFSFPFVKKALIKINPIKYWDKLLKRFDVE